MFKTLPQDDSGPLHLGGQQPAELLIRDLEAYDGGRTTDSESVALAQREIMVPRFNRIWLLTDSCGDLDIRQDGCNY